MPYLIEHNEAGRRFEAQVDTTSCVLDYQISGDRMTITHTGVPAAVAGRGIASALTQAAMDEARKRGWSIVPACSYAAAWLARHPDYRNLLA